MNDFSKMTSFEAAMIADGEFGLTDYEESFDAYVAAFQLLIDSGLAWQLQGRVGRTAADLIAAGHCAPADRITH